MDSSKDKRHYGACDEHTQYDLSLFHDKVYSFLEHYPMRIMISLSNMHCNFKFMSHGIAARRGESQNADERQSLYECYFAFY